MNEPVPWLVEIAARRGLRYEPDADERWMRAWEPFVTLRTPLAYRHALHLTGPSASLTVARFTVTAPQPAGPPLEPASWIVLGQDPRIPADARAAATNDFHSPFAESGDLVAMPRIRTSDPVFDGRFAAFARSADEAARALTPSVRKIALAWGIPLHFEVRAGSFVLAPVGLPPEPRSLDWLLTSAPFFGEKAAKRLQ